MPINRPYKRNARIFSDGQFTEGGRARYIKHKKYAQSPEHYIRAYLLIQKDLLNLFDFVEPADINSNTYSFRIHELLLRTCVEIEANCKAILQENIFTKSGDWNMGDYKKINATHRLSLYEVVLPIWKGIGNIRKPFLNWSTGGSLPWYAAYNTTKHNRHSEFEQAKFEHLIDAVTGLNALLTSQFLDEEFSPTNGALGLEGPNDGTEQSIGGYFRVKYATDWIDDEKYEFNWQDIKDETDPFHKINYDIIA